MKSGRQVNAIGLRLIIMLAVVLLATLFWATAYARPSDTQLMDTMKAQFNSAIIAGDVNKAKQIWASIDTKFTNDHMDKLTARAVVFGGGAIFRSELLQQLYAKDNSQLKAMALFLSSINLSMGMARRTTATGKLSGIVRGEKHKRFAGAVIIVGGQQAITNAKGAFSLTALPVGTFSLFVYAPGYKLNISNQKVTTDKSASVAFRLNALNSPPPLTRQQIEAKMAKVLEKLPNKPTTRSKGTEILIGTLLDADSAAPIAKATVTLICEANVTALQAVQSPQSLSKQVKSDSRGRFTITDIPAGLCDFSITKTDLTFANFEKKARAGNARAYAFSQKVRIMVNANHRHEHTWKLKIKTMKAGEK